MVKIIDHTKIEHPHAQHILLLIVLAVNFTELHTLTQATHPYVLLLPPILILHVQSYNYWYICTLHEAKEKGTYVTNDH